MITGRVSRTLTFALAFSGLALFPVQPAFSQDDAEEVIIYRCNDLLVIGRVSEQSYTPLDMEDDTLGRGAIEAQIAVKQVIRGEPFSLPIQAHYVAHSYINSDRDFLFILSPDGDSAGAYHVAGLYDATSPRLAPDCQ